MNYHAATGPLVPSAPLPLTSDMDQMFSDLGLETFVAKSAGTGSSQMGNNQPEPVSMVPSTSSGSLSLEEKQRMVRQQEQSQRLQNSADLVGKSGPLRLQQQKPVDLASKLIDSNLNQIKSPTGNNNANNGSWMTSPTSSNDNAWGAMTSSTSGGNWSANFTGTNSMMTGGTQPQQQPAKQWSVTGSSVGLSGNGNNNWSALDNLLPAKPQKTPMNQMSGQQPLLMSHSQATSTVGSNKNQPGTNQLSQQDIMEFLG